MDGLSSGFKGRLILSEVRKFWELDAADEAAALDLD